MQDPGTEIEVPTLAVTIHPQTGQKLSLGATYLNPLTETVAPLEIGGPMRTSEGGKIVPILGVALDQNTGTLRCGSLPFSARLISSPSFASATSCAIQL